MLYNYNLNKIMTDQLDQQFQNYQTELAVMDFQNLTPNSLISF